MFVVPLYFQVTASASPATAGFYLVPAVVGNTIGGLACGAYIKRHGRYKLPTVVAAVVAGLCHTLTTVRWTGNTSIFEALYIFPGGLGTGIAHSSTFVAITAGTTDEELAIAGSGLYLCGNLGSLLGVTFGSSVIREVMARTAAMKLKSEADGGRSIIENALSDVNFIHSLKDGLRKVIVASYVVGFRADFGWSQDSYLTDDANV